MKTVYKCDGCKAEFDSKKECDEHEKMCLSTENLLKRIKELEDKVEMLEAMLKANEYDLKKYPSPLNVPSYPCDPVYPYTPQPITPFPPAYKPMPIWCSTNASNRIKDNEESGKKES